MALKPETVVENGEPAPSDSAVPSAEASGLARALPVLVVALTAAFSLRRLANTDTWWHLAAGRWIVTHGRIPATDPLSWTVPDHPWINVQWLFDVMIYGLFRVGGPSLVVIVSAVFYSVAMAIFLVNVRRYVGPILASLLGVWAVVISQSRFEIRPEMVSYVLIQVILWLYATGRVAGRKRLWFLPLVMCVFANSHSLFIIGAFVIGCYMLGTLLSSASFLPAGWRPPVHPQVRSQVLATGTAALAATVVNPFFVKGALFPLALMTELSGKQPFLRGIGELIPPFDAYFVTFSLKAYRVLFFVALGVTLGALIVSALRGPATGGWIDPDAGRAERRRRERMSRRKVGASRPVAPASDATVRPIPLLDLGGVAVLVGVSYLSFLARRNTALLAIVGGPPLAMCLSVLGAGLRGRVLRTADFARRLAVVALAFVLVGACWFVTTNGYYRWNNELREFGLGIIPHCFPERAARFIKEQKLPGPMFNDFTNGGYFSWSEPVPGGVYVDGRGEVYGAAFLARLGTLLARPSEWQAEMDRRGVQTATLFHWWENHQTLFRYLTHDRRWDVVYYDETTIVAVRHQGNAETIGRAALAFLEQKPAIERSLLDPRTTWYWQLGKIRGNKAYSRLQYWMGNRDEGRRFSANMARLNQRRG